MEIFIISLCAVKLTTKIKFKFKIVLKNVFKKLTELKNMK